MRRSDIKQIRRRLTCAALRLLALHTSVQIEIKYLFEKAQRLEVALSKGDAPAQLEIEDLRPYAVDLSELATWYKAGHEQLNAMIAVAEAHAKELK